MSEEQPKTISLLPKWKIHRDAEGKPDVQAAREVLYKEFEEHELGYLALKLEDAIQTTAEHYRDILRALWGEPAVQELMEWLRDNVDGDTDLHFDNEGKVRSDQVLEALEKYVITRKESNAD